MIYRSNLTAPDLAPNFKHLVSSPMGHSFGHDVPRDWGDKPNDEFWSTWKNNGFWTHDEAAILWNVVKAMPGHWLDIGACTGWTTAHMLSGGAETVLPIDPMFTREDFTERYWENLEEVENADNASISTFQYSHVFFERKTPEQESFSGICIDGDHTPPAPMDDAQNAARHVSDNGVIIFHDALGLPVREAALWLMNQGFKARWYETPHGVIVCWRGDFVPPDHVSDPNLPDLKARCPEFDFTRCS